jgi:NSS family neurotransmitter:Na+ symporter
MSNQESWGSRIGLILAMAGNAVGLGNFLRFPVQAVQNGGGTFIIPYLICFLLMGIPLLFVEWAMGRYGGKFGHHSTPFILDSFHRARIWKYIGVFGIFTNLAVAAYYCYLESWTLGYVYHSVMGSFGGKTEAQISGFFDQYIGLNSWEPLVFWIICLLLNTWILSRGLSGGVELASTIGMPLLILFGAFLAFKGVTLTAGSEGAKFDGLVGFNFLWSPASDFGATLLSPKVWLAAAGQIFFTLSLGMGSIHCYASYLKPKEDVALNAMTAGWTNEFVEVVLGSAILIPISVGYFGIENVTEMVKNGGLGLGFRTLPALFQQWGSFMALAAGVMWFGLLFFAGITSSLAMGTPVMGFLQDEFGWKRQRAAWLFGVLVFLLGLPTVLFFEYGVFDEYDYWAGTISLVVFAFAEILLFAWIFGMEKGWKEITDGADIQVPYFFRYVIQYVTPVILGFVLVMNLPDIGHKLLNRDIAEQVAAVRADADEDTRLKTALAGLNLSEEERTGLPLDYQEMATRLQDQVPMPLMEQKLRPLFDGTAALSVGAFRERAGAYFAEAELRAKEAEVKWGVKKIFVNLSRLGLLAVFLGIALLVRIADRKRKKEGRYHHGN